MGREQSWRGRYLLFYAACKTITKQNPMTDTNVLIVDDDQSYRKLLVYITNKAGFIITEADDVKSAMLQLEQHPVDVVLTDVHMPDGNGVELTQAIKAAYPLTEVVVITGEGTIADGVQAMKYGAFDYLQKRDADTQIVSLLTHAAEKSRLQKRIQELENEIQHNVSGDIIDQNAAQIDKAALIVKAIGSPLRQKIIHLILAQGKASVTEIYTALDLPQAIASQHLLVLKNAGLVKPSAKAKKYSTRLTTAALQKPLHWLIS